MQNCLELAKGLQNSNEPSVAELAIAYLDLLGDYEELRHKYVEVCSENIRLEHFNLLQSLPED